MERAGATLPRGLDAGGAEDAEGEKQAELDAGDGTRGRTSRGGSVTAGSSPAEHRARRRRPSESCPLQLSINVVEYCSMRSCPIITTTMKSNRMLTLVSNQSSTISRANRVSSSATSLSASGVTSSGYRRLM